MIIMKIKPAVSKNWLITIAGIVWSLVGIILILKANEWLLPVETGVRLIYISTGMICAVILRKVLFIKIASKNIMRICEFTSKGCIFAFQPWRSYLLILVMIFLGMILRNSLIPKTYLSILYLSIGGGLFMASFRYYAALARGK